MAGQIIVSSIKTDNDNSISFLANTGDVIFSANTSHGIPGSYIENGTITSDKLATGGILTVDLGDESVTSLKIANGAISTVDIADGAITNAKITDSTITTGKFASSANSAITGKSVAMAIVFGG